MAICKVMTIAVEKLRVGTFNIHFPQAAVALCIGLGPLYAEATEFSVTPQAKSVMRLEDNVRGSSTAPEGAFGFDLSSQLDLAAQSDQFRTNVLPRVNLRRFIIGDNLDADEYGIKLNHGYIHERYQAGLNFSYGRDSTLTTEATDTGRINTVTNRDAILVQPTISYLVTDRIVVHSGFQFNTVSYANAESTGFVDYEYKQANIGSTYGWREDVEVFADFYVSKFETADGRSSSLSYSGQAGLTWHWSNSLQTTGGIGWNQSNIHFIEVAAVAINKPPGFVLIGDPGDASVGGPIASASIQKKFELTTANLDYSRQVSPSGRGAQSSADHISLKVVRRLAEKLKLQIDSDYDLQSTQSEQINFTLQSGSLNRDYISAGASLSYQLSRAWGLTGAYRFVHRKSTGNASQSVSDSNGLFFSVEYNGEPHWL